MAATNTQTVFAAAAVAFVGASALLVGLKVEAAPERDVEGSFMREFFGGFGAIASDRKLALIVTLYGIQTFVAGSLNVLIVVASLELLDLGQAGVGFLNSAVGIGGLLGAVAAFALVGRQRLASDFAFGLLLWGIPIALIGIFPQPPVALILLAIVGVGNTVVDVAALTLLQRTVPDEVLTRVFGVIQSVFIGTVGLGAIFAPLMINAVGIRWALILTGALLPLSAGLTWRRITSLDADVVAPTKEIALLRTIPLFRPLPATTIDELALSLIQVRADAGNRDRPRGRPRRPLLRHRLRRGRRLGQRGARGDDGRGRPLRRDRAPARRAAHRDRHRQRRGQPPRARARRVPERGHRPSGERRGRGRGRRQPPVRPPPGHGLGLSA